MFNSLFGKEYDVDRETIKAVINKSKATKQVTNDNINKKLSSEKTSLAEKIELIKAEVYRILGKQVNNVKVIYSKEELYQYLSEATKQKHLSIDTETNNSLDPLTCKLMGLCLYVNGQKQVYVPINHINPDTGIRLSNQLTEADVVEVLSAQIANKNDCKFIFHNGKFDYEVLKMTCHVKTPVDYDTMIAAKLLNENEPAKLKVQYQKYIDPEQESYSIDKLFQGLKYEVLPPELFAIYAATDAFDTYKLYEYQMTQFSKVELSRLYKLFLEVEMPMVEVTAEMELAGIALDQAFCEMLANKYHKLLEAAQKEVETELLKLNDTIAKWRISEEATAREKIYATEKDIFNINYEKNFPNKDESGKRYKYGKSLADKLENPVKMSSATQLSILFYDVLGLRLESDPSARSVGEDELEELDRLYNLPICNALLQYRSMFKLVGTYIDAIPKMVSPYDGRIHAKFNQMGSEDKNVVTGRFSSTDPNMQNIPSHTQEIRLMFAAAPGNVLVGADYSQQEPKIATYYSQDPAMLDAYLNGKDLYAIIAQAMYNNKYTDNLEFYPAGTEIELDGQKVICGNKTHTNKAGKKRRGSAKTVLLAIFYGMGIGTVAEKTDKTYEEAQELVDNLYKGFPKLKQWMDESLDNLKKYGYVEDWYGRIRRIPDIYLEPYVVSYKDPSKIERKNFNPFLNCSNREVNDADIKFYKAQCNQPKLSKKKYNELKEEANKKGILIQANTGRIAQAERQCVNARIQGGAATLTKLAMQKIYKDKILNDLGFKMVITVHDEVLGECPKENAELAAKRLSEVMVNAASDIINVPMKCDATISSHWYSDELTSTIQDEYTKLITGNEDKGILPLEPNIAFEQIVEKRCEFTRDELYNTIYKNMPIK